MTATFANEAHARYSRDRERLIVRTKLFRSKRSQAVRLPKEVAFPEGVKEVTIFWEGARRVIVAANTVWGDFFDAPGIELPERDEPRAQEPEVL